MLPGKTYKPEDLIEIAWRRRWWIAIPFVLVALTTTAVSFFLPNRYRSESLILVVPQRVPQEFVRPTVTAQVDERLQTISQQILSRTRLERIILDLNLYAEERRKGIMEDVVEKMRTQDVRIDIARSANRQDSASFRVSYTSENPRTAMQVTERLASLFIEENLRDRELLAEGTDQFLESQLEDARRQLLDNERKVEDYKRRYSGQLPTELQSNLQVLQNTQAQYQAVVEAMNRDREQRTMLERMLSDALAEVPQVSPSADPSQTAGLPAALQLEAARAALRAMELRLKPEHPDYIRAKKIVAELEQKAAQEQLQQPVSGAAEAPPINAADASKRRRVNELRMSIEAKDREIADKVRQEQALRGRMGEYQARVEAAPGRETELVSLTRDYETLRARYNNLLSKSQDAKIASNLEKRQIGEQFKVIDPARMPERPESPNRQMINLFGALAGLGIGLGLALLLEYRDTSMRSDDDVMMALSLPVLASIPKLITAAERRRMRRRRVVTSVAAVAVVTVGLAAALWRLGVLTGRF